jgi:hypothetical protein
MQETRTNDTPALPIGIEQPRGAMTAVANQKLFQWVNNQDFYSLIPAPYHPFYNNWVRTWLYWYDGYVPWIHGGAQGILSTGICTMIVNRVADSVFGGNLMFSNSRKPKIRVQKEEGKSVGAALDFITNNWTKAVDFRTRIKRAIRYAFAGGFSLLKLNRTGGELWMDALRADRFFCDLDGRGELRKVVAISSVYEKATPNKSENRPRYVLCEERRYEKIGLFSQEIPVVEYKIYETSSPINYFSITDNCMRWEDLPKEVKQAFKREYDGRLNEPKALNGFNDLGCYLVRGSEDVSNVPQIGLGESLLAHIMTYLYEYDFYNTCFNTDMYLARGRVLVPKGMQGPRAIAQANSVMNNFGTVQNAGLDSFLYTKVESTNPDAQKPEAIQFELRATEWKEARNLLLESIATSIGISTSTLASYLNDGSNRTAREVSAEESSTTLFVENARRRFEYPINSLLKSVLRFYGYIDDVEVRWSRAGMTNVTVLVDTLTKAVQGGLISQEAAHSAYNYDNDEEQNAEDYAKVQQDRQAQQNTLFGGDIM